MIQLTDCGGYVLNQWYVYTNSLIELRNNVYTNDTKINTLLFVDGQVKTAGNEDDQQKKYTS